MRRKTTPSDVQIAKDRLNGNGAWNGNGLLQFLSVTARKDTSRLWMEPLRDLCQKVVFANEDDVELELDSDEAFQMNELRLYAERFFAALAQKE